MGSRGRFISFEGIDGCGKSTQLSLLADRLRPSGTQVVETREPGGSPGAEAIRRLLVEGETGRWSPETELLLFTAARRDHVERLIRPGLDGGSTVLSDRFADSTRIYQGAVRAALRPMVDTLHRLMIGIEPDLTIILDVDPEDAFRRGAERNSAEDRFESFGLEFQKRLREGFLGLAGEFPDRCRVVSGAGTREQVAERIAAEVGVEA